MSGALAPGWSIELEDGVRRTDGGSVLIGGSPLRILRLTPAGVRWLDDVAGGRPPPPSLASRRLALRLVDAGLARARPPAGAGFRREQLAVVVPVRDDADGLRRTLAAIGTEPVEQVVVVDDASADATAIAAAATTPPGAPLGAVRGGATLLRNRRRTGPAGARERGWRATTAPVVAFVDADIEADGDWLAPLLAHFDDPAVGAVAPRVRCRPGGGPAWLAEYERVCFPLDVGARAGAVRPGGAVPYVPSAVLLVRRAALEAAGGFDPDLQVGEDVDLVWRLHGAGWRVDYEPAVVVRHPMRPGPPAWARQRLRYGTSAAPLAARHGWRVAPIRLSGWSALALAAVLSGRPALGLGVGAGSTLALAPKLRALRRPVTEALRIAGLGNLRAGVAVADALWRPYWPLAALLALVSRRSRPALVAAAVVPPVLEWRRRRPRLGPLRFLLLRRADDLAYGTGVWIGCVRARSGAALRPTFTGPLPPPEPVAMDTADAVPGQLT